jgi:hypothetical protein
MLLPLPLAIALALGACAGPPDRPQDPAQAMEQFREGGYASSRVPIKGWDASWVLGQQALDVSWLAPEQVQGAAPLILYLPGLGESAQAGELWRRAWAEAGYAVLSIQAPEDGPAIYSSQEALAGTFRRLAEVHYSDASSQRRLKLVELALGEARRRAEAGDPALAGVDWQNWLVAGFDLGAQAASALSGERQTGKPRRSVLRPRAAILVSPHVDSAYDTDRFTNIELSVLSIAGLQDEDPFNWIPSPQQRLGLWRGLQVKGSYQLTSSAADHALLSGNRPAPMAGRERNGRPDRSGGAGPMGAPLGFDEGRGGRSGGPQGGPGGRPGGHMPGGGGMHERFDARQGAYIQAVSLAFIDLQLRRSVDAGAWLDNKAGAWLGYGTRLEKKP